MDIQNILDQAKQRGLSAIDSIRNSITSVPQIGNLQINLPGPKPVVQPVVNNPVVQPSFTKPSLTSLPDIANLQINLPEPKPVIQPTNASFEDWAKTINQRVSFQIKNVSSQFEDYVKNNLGPTVKNYVDTINATGPEITPVDIALAAPEKRKELITKLGEQQKALGQLQAETGLTSLQAINVPSTVFNKSIIQPSYQTYQLQQRRNLTGQIPTQEEINAANIGELNKTTNELLNRKITQITPDMTTEQVSKASENNKNYYMSEIRDTVVSLIDFDVLLGIGGIAKEAIEKAPQKIISKVAPDVSEKILAKESSLTKAIIENDIPKIEKEIGKPLNELQLAKIEEINNLPIDESFKKTAIESTTTQRNFKTEAETFLNDYRKKFNDLIESKKPKITENEQFIKDYNKQREFERVSAAGSQGLKEKFDSFYYGLVNSFYSKKAVVNDTIDKLVKNGLFLEPTKDPRMVGMKANNTSMQTSLFLDDLKYWDTVDEAINANTGILPKKEINSDFGNYLIARRKVTLHEKGIQIDPKYAEDAKFVALNEQKYSKAAPAFYEMGKRFLDQTVKDGIKTAEEVARLKLNEDYAPFRVIIDDLIEKRKIKLMERKIDVAKDTVIKKLQDFETNIVENPLETFQQMVASYVNERNRNEYARSFGELVRQGVIPDAFMIRDAKNVKLREYYNSNIENLRETTDKLQKIFNRDKKAANKVFREVNNLNKKGYDLVTFTKDTQEDSKFAEKIGRAIERRFDKKDELMAQIDEYFQGILKVKEKGEDVLTDKKFFDKTSRMIDTRESWVQDLVDIGADMLGKKKPKYMLEKVPNLKARKDFIKNASVQDVYNYIYEIYNLPYTDFKRLLQKATTKNLKIKNVLEEIDSIKNAQIINKTVNSIISMPQPEVDKLLLKIKNKESAIGKVMKEVKYLSDNRVYNEVVNNLVKKSPDELANIQKQIEKKSPILEEMVDSILKQQEKIDVNKGIIKQLKEEEKLIQDLPKRGLTTVSWLKDGITEIAAIPKKMESSFLEDMAVSNIYNSAIFKGLEDFTRGFKGILTTVNPKSKIKQIRKQSTQIATLGEAELVPQMLNPAGFVKAMKDAWIETPEYKQWVNAGGGFSQFNFNAAQRELATYTKKGGNVNKVSLNNFENILGMDEVASRFQIFQVYKNKFLKEGMSEENAVVRATYQVNQILPDYGQTGVYTRLIEAVYPYFRINLQSATTLGKQFIQNPTGTAFKLGLRVGLPAIAVTAFNNLTPGQREAYNDLTEDQKSRGLIIVPMNPQKDENGKWKVYEYPVEEVVMNFYNPFRRSVEAAINAGENWVFPAAMEIISPQSLSNYLQGTTGINVPYSGESFRKNIIGQAGPLVRIPIELSLNKIGYTNQPIVPQNLQNLSPFMQYDNRTTPLAKELGSKLNFSPKIIDYLMTNLSVGALDYVEAPLQQALADGEDSDYKKVTGMNPTQELIDTILFIKKGGGATTGKMYEQIKQLDSQKAETNKVALELFRKGDINALKDLVNNGNVTKEQFKAIENVYQKEQATQNLTPIQKSLYDQSAGVVQKLLEKNPNLASDIQVVNAVKLEEKKSKNIDTTGFNFAPSVGKTGTGGSLIKIAKPKTSKLKVKKPKKSAGISAPKIKKPGISLNKKLKIAKPKKIKQPRLAKVKPLKKIKRF